MKDVSQIYRRRQPFPPQEVSILENIETSISRDEALPMGQSIRASIRSQTKSYSGKDKILPQPKGVARGQLATLNEKRRKLILSDTSPSSEEEARTKQPALKDTFKPAKVKSDRGK